MVNSRRLLLAGLVVSLACLAYLFAGAVHAARLRPEPFSLEATTAVGTTGRVVTGVFALLNIPPAIVNIALELLLPSIPPLPRTLLVYGVTLVAVLAWWWLLSLAQRRQKTT